MNWFDSIYLNTSLFVVDFWHFNLYYVNLNGYVVSDLLLKDMTWGRIHHYYSQSICLQCNKTFQNEICVDKWINKKKNSKNQLIWTFCNSHWYFFNKYQRNSKMITHCVMLFCLCLVYPMLSVSLNCPFLIAPSVISIVYLFPTLERQQI
jgi:hypothetical protein